MSGVVIAKDQEINDYLAGQDGSATFNGAWIDTKGFSLLSFNIAWTAVAATSGTLSFDATNDPAKASTSIISSVTVSTIEGNSGALTVSTSAGVVGVNFSRLFRFMRLTYTRSAGGGASQFNAFVYLSAL
jgi:hypothetical protein